MFPKLCVVNIRRHFWRWISFQAEAGKFRGFLPSLQGWSPKKKRSLPISQTPVLPLDVAWTRFDWSVCRDTSEQALSFASEQNTLETIGLEFTTTIILASHLVAPALLMLGFKKAKFEEFGLKKANMATLDTVAEAPHFSLYWIKLWRILSQNFIENTF